MVQSKFINSFIAKEVRYNVKSVQKCVLLSEVNAVQERKGVAQQGQTMPKTRTPSTFFHKSASWMKLVVIHLI